MHSKMQDNDFTQCVLSHPEEAIDIQFESMREGLEMRWDVAIACIKMVDITQHPQIHYWVATNVLMELGVHSY